MSKAGNNRNTTNISRGSAIKMNDIGFFLAIDKISDIRSIVGVVADYLTYGWVKKA